MITLKTLPQATAQEVFDQVAKHLLTQGAESTNSEAGGCAYRGDHGMKCAAGCLIADDEYRFKMENKTWPRLIEDGMAPRAHAHLITKLQDIHDNEPVDDWMHNLRQVAVSNGLSVEILDV